MNTKYMLFAFLLGALAAFADGLLFSNAWAALEWRGPIAEWLAESGMANLAGWFGLVWIRVPTFIVAACLGVLIARLLVKQWIAGACFGSVGFAGVPFLLTAWHTRPLFEWNMLIRAQVWNVISIALLFLGAWLYMSWRDRDKGALAQ